jgi:hypothetical protein
MIDQGWRCGCKWQIKMQEKKYLISVSGLYPNALL